MEFRKIISLLIVILLLVFTVPKLSLYIYKSSFKDMHVEVDKEIKEQVEVLEAHTSKQEGVLKLRKLKENVEAKYLEIALKDSRKRDVGVIYVDVENEMDTKIPTEKTYNIPNIKYGYVSRVDKMPDSKVVDVVVRMEQLMHKALRHSDKLVDIIGLNFDAVKTKAIVTETGEVKYTSEFIEDTKEFAINVFKLPSELMSEALGIHLPPGVITAVVMLL